jgi:hypothetical protein
MGNAPIAPEVQKVRIWHKFSKTIPRGWPEHGCLYFTVNRGSTIRDLLQQINRHRRPDYYIPTLYTIGQEDIPPTRVINTSDFYI